MSTWVHRFAARVDASPERVAFIELNKDVEGPRLTVAQLWRRAAGVADAVREHRGQPVLVLHPPGLEYVVAVVGCLLAGAIAVPAYPPTDPRAVPRLLAIVADSKATIGLTTSQIRPLVAPLGPMAWVATDEVAAMDGAAADVSPADVAVIQYTSGSTGDPRGVVLTYENLAMNADLIAERFGHGEGDVGVTWVPPYHDMGLIGGILQPIWIGGTNVLLSPLDFLERPSRWLRAIHTYRAHTSGGPNFAFDLARRKVTPEERSRLDLSCWKTAYNGAEPVRASTLRRFAEAFASCGFQPSSFLAAYGLAEATLMATAARWQGEDPVNCGLPGEGHEVRVVDPESLQSTSTEGAVLLRGPSVSRGYWNRPEDPRFGLVLPDGSGPWLRTGDLGVLGEDGLRITGRIADLIVIRGKNLHPPDLEHSAEQAVPELRPGCAAAVQVDDRLVLVHEVRADASPEVAARVAAAVTADHGVPVDEVLLVARRAVPKTSSGKVRRHEVAQRVAAGSLSVLARWSRPIVPLDGLLHRLSSVLRRPIDADADMRLSELGVDSLTALELRDALQTDLGVEVPLSLLQGDPTLGQLAGLGAPAPSVSRPAGPIPALSLFWFADATVSGSDPYAVLLEGAQLADRLGFSAVWVPERHFHAFGGPFPDPAVVAAALATHTRTLRLRAGSVVLPLHDPARVAESWAMVDRLSGGRVDLAMAAGWDAASFALAPDAYADRGARVLDGVDEVRALWRGEAVTRPDGRGDPVALQTWPRPVQPELSVWLTAVHDGELFEEAGRRGLNVLTALLMQTPEALAGKVARYRAARREAGHDGDGIVSLMVHAHVVPDGAREAARGPLRRYLASSVNLWSRESSQLAEIGEERREELLTLAVERYLERAAVVGSPDEAASRLAALGETGVDEIACLVDFGPPAAGVLTTIRSLGALLDAAAPTTDRPDVFAPAHGYTRADDARSVGRFPFFQPVTDGSGTHATVGGQPALMLGSLDYLGLGADPRVRAAARRAVAEHGASTSGSRFYNGTTPLHLALEDALAEFLDRDDALVVGSGYQAVMAAVGALLGPDSTLVLDAASHACLFDAAATARCRVRRFAHEDCVDLDRVLAEVDGPVLVAVEGQYSNDGDLASLVELRRVCDRHRARLLVDDAHGLAVLGPTGRGSEELHGVRADLLVGSLSKGLGSVGGWIAGDRAVVDYVRLHGRANLFSASTIAPSSVAAALEALRILQAEPERVERLWANARHWRSTLQAGGLDTGRSEGPIVPILIGTDDNCIDVAQALLAHGVYVNPVLPPSAEPGRALLRTTVNALHDRDQLDRAAAVVIEVVRAVLTARAGTSARSG